MLRCVFLRKQFFYKDPYFGSNYSTPVTKNTPSLTHQRTIMKKRSPVKTFLIMCIFALCAYGFWHNTQNQLTAIVNHEVSSIDQTGTVPKEDIRYLEGFQKDFTKKFGIDLYIKIVADVHSVEHPQQPSCISIHIAPESAQISIYISPLVVAALGQGYIDTYNQEYLQPYVQAGKWQTGLTYYINALTKQLTKVLQPPPSTAQP